MIKAINSIIQEKHGFEIFKVLPDAQLSFSLEKFIEHLNDYLYSKKLGDRDVYGINCINRFYKFIKNVPKLMNVIDLRNPRTLSDHCQILLSSIDYVNQHYEFDLQDIKDSYLLVVSKAKEILNLSLKFNIIKKSETLERIHNLSKDIRCKESKCISELLARIIV